MRNKKILSVVTSVALATATAFSACACVPARRENATPINTDPYDIPQDYCRTYYEVFVRSFADGNGDGVGDIRGLINNLDYLNDGDDSTTTDLGINGIWMMPINLSPSYHKYDVENYYEIDDEYGTLDDFDELVKECDKRDIWLQMDLVLNHTSSRHDWFYKACKAAKNGNDPLYDADMQKYNIVQSDKKPSDGTWYKVGGTTDYWYLANFSSDMPDLNLKNSEVRTEIQKIVDFWLERGVRSFRLDAVPWACANVTIYNSDNDEFWSWFNNYCDEKGAQVYGEKYPGLSKYCYNVGEVWADGGTINDYFGTGMTCFNYVMGGGPSAGFINAANGYSANGAVALTKELVNIQSDVIAKDQNALLSNFLSNHDNARSAGYLDYDIKKIKTAAALYLLAPGNPYIYYGEEIGMAGYGNDPSKRLPFNWGDSENGHAVSDPPGVDVHPESRETLASQTEQTVDADSILTYYRKIIKLRNRFPEIGRGRIKGYALDANGSLVKMDESVANYVNVNYDNKYIAAYTLTWNDKTVLIVHDAGDKAVSLNLMGLTELEGFSLVGNLTAAGGQVSYVDGSLNLPAYSVAILKK